MSTSRSCEQVRSGHPDKLCDRIADSILDAILDSAGACALTRDEVRTHRSGLEVLAKDDQVVLSGEVRVLEEVARRLAYDRIVRQVFEEAGYLVAPEVLDLIGVQQPELQANSDRCGAGDQGIMIGYATSETAEMMPLEFSLVTRICRELDDLIGAAGFEWLRPDGKAQVTLGADGGILKVVIGAQHAESIDGVEDPKRMQELIRDQLVEEVLYRILGRERLSGADMIVNGSGSFSIGGPIGDAGVLGRKIVCDAYGPGVPVGGGAFSGKDPTKIDRSGAYMARAIAVTALQEVAGNARSVTVKLAYAIGNYQPEMVVATTSEGVDITEWVPTRFPDLSPEAIADRFDLWRLRDPGWCYADTAHYGHFGRVGFPWERTVS